MEQLLKERNVGLEEEDVFQRTPLEAALVNISKPNISKNNKESLKKIVDMLLAKGSKIRRKALVLLWYLDYDSLIYFLENHRPLRHRSIVYKEDILKELNKDLEDILNDIKEEKAQYNRNYNAYESMPPYLLEEYDRQEERIRRFKNFCSSYNSETGEFSLASTFENVYADLENPNNNNGYSLTPSNFANLYENLQNLNNNNNNNE